MSYLLRLNIQQGNGQTRYNNKSLTHNLGSNQVSSQAAISAAFGAASTYFTPDAKNGKYAPQNNHFLAIPLVVSLSATTSNQSIPNAWIFVYGEVFPTHQPVFQSLPNVSDGGGFPCSSKHRIQSFCSNLSGLHLLAHYMEKHDWAPGLQLI